jgi:diaminohydroxyphosphoribosylaminopyrimidine deaminase/5-amino-6-(5-phosphoribosylamino)uracil reductase
LNPSGEIMQRDERYMRMAIRLSRKGGDRPSCEPRVGAVIVKDDRVVGRGFAGQQRAAPAALLALDEAGPLARGAALYTNIDPCYDAVEPQPCVGRLAGARLGRVVVGVTSNLTGPGEPARGTALDRLALGRLTEAGVEVVTGVCEGECRELNEAYSKYSRTGLPFVTVKYAQSLDGRIATSTGDSQWISGPASLRLAHRLRREHDAIMVGIGTVIADDPRLTVRLVSGRDPLRVVVDSRLRIPITSRVLAEGAAHRTMIATTEMADPRKIDEVKDLGADLIVAPLEAGMPGVDLQALLAELGRRAIASVLVEGGAGIITSLLGAGQVDRLVVAVAPKIIGRGVEAIGELGITSLGGAITFSHVKTHRLGTDVIFDGRLAAAPPGASG